MMAISSQPEQQTNSPLQRDKRRFLSAPTLTFLVIITQIPFAVTIYYSMPPKLFFVPTLENRRIALIESPYFDFLINTLLITGLSTVVALLLGIVAAYSMAFYPTQPNEPMA